jgi:hypothetical protein
MTRLSDRALDLAICLAMCAMVLLAFYMAGASAVQP